MDLLFYVALPEWIGAILDVFSFFSSSIAAVVAGYIEAQVMFNFIFDAVVSWNVSSFRV